MRLSIRTKVLLAVSLSLVLIFTLIAYLLVQQNTSRLRSSLNEQSMSFAALATEPIGNTFVLYKDSGQIRITQQVNSLLELDPDVTAIRIVTIDGTELYSSLDSPGPPLEESLAASFEPQLVKNDQGYVSKVVQPYFEDSGAHRYSVVYQISSERIEQSVSEIVGLILYTGAVILAISIGATGLLLNSLFIRPLKDVSRSANIISSGDFDHKITSKKQDEIGDLASSVEKMADYLKADIAKLRELDKLKSEFMMITSHNLRTPITVIQGYIDMAKDAKSVKEVQSIMKTVQESVVRLHLLAEDVLTISTLETGKTSVRKSPTPLKNFLQSIGNEYQLLAEKKNIKWQFDLDIADDANLELNRSNMRSALGNLVDNAIKFTKPGGSVSVDGLLSGSGFVFRVKDSGIGIAQDEMPKLFTKFHRGTSTLNYDYEGMGIGLYLAKLIVRQHGGSIEVKSVPNEGSEFAVYLPVSRQPK
jgi:signal transduction histidine kinase